MDTQELDDRLSELERRELAIERLQDLDSQISTTSSGGW